MSDGSKGALGDNGSILTIAGLKRDGLLLRNEKGAEGGDMGNAGRPEIEPAAPDLSIYNYDRVSVQEKR